MRNGGGWVRVKPDATSHRAIEIGMMAWLLGATACAEPPAPASIAAKPPVAAEQTLAGWVPTADNEVPAIVVFRKRDSDSVAAPASVPFMDQVARTFVPPLLFVRTGHPAEFRNSDTEMHNVNVKDAKTRDQAFNVAVGTDDKYVYTFRRDGVYEVSCDVHAGMSAQIIVASTPHVTIADRAGRFHFPKITAGSYDVTVYAGAQTIERIITVDTKQPDIDLREAK